MTKRLREELMNKSKEELVDLIANYRSMYSFVSETCVSESKLNISSEQAISNIRDYLYKKQYDLE